MVSILILTKNEEHDLGGCLESVFWSDDVHVYDSMSTDRTVEIAHEHGAQVHKRIFDGYASQRNAALESINFKYDWVFLLDADERLSSDMGEELRLRLPSMPFEIAALRVRPQ